MYVGNCSTLWLEARNPPGMSGGAKTVRRIGAAMLMLQSTKDRDTPEEQAAMFVELIKGIREQLELLDLAEADPMACLEDFIVETARFRDTLYICTLVKKLRHFDGDFAAVVHLSAVDLYHVV